MKKLLIGVVSVLALVVLLLSAAPFWMPTAAIKTRLTEAVLAATGRELRIGGALRLSVLPTPGVVAEDVSFANPPGGKAAEMAHLTSLDVALRLWPLLGGRVEVARLVLTGPVIALEVDGNGRGNWVFTPARREGVAATGAPSGGKAGGMAAADISLDDIRIVDGKASYLDHRTNTAHSLEKINLQLFLPGLAGPQAGGGAAVNTHTVEGSAVWNGEEVKLTLRANDPGALIRGEESGFALKLAAAPLTLAFTGAMTGLPPVRTTGVVDLATPSLRRLAAWAGTAIALKGDGLGPLAIKGSITVAGAEMAFSDAEIALDAIRAKGALRVTTGGVRPVLKGQLAVERLDLNPYLPAEPAVVPAPAAKGQVVTKTPGEWSDAPIDLTGLKAADAELDLHADAIVFRKIQIDRAKLAVRLKDGRLVADLVEIALYRGAGKGRLVVDGAAAMPGLDLSLTLAHVDIEPLLSASLGMDRLSGAGSFELAVAGAGKTQRDLIAALNGKGALNLANGQVKGVNFLLLARNAGARAAGGDGGAENHTEFAALTATFRIIEGVLHNDDLMLKSLLGLITGAGSVNLPARMIDYRVVAAIAGAVRVPVQIAGSWDHPSYKAEFGEVLKGFTQPPGTARDPLKTLLPDNANPLRRLLPSR